LETSVKEALKQAGRTGRDLEVNTDRKTSEVSHKPLIGFTIFRSRRPFWVLPVGRSTCGCITCYGMRLVFTALMDFDQWENVCPQVFELVQDVRRHAGRLSLTVETLLELLTCDVDSDFGYFKKSCAFSECKTCRVHDFFNNLTIRDGLSLPARDPMTKSNMEHILRLSFPRSTRKSHRARNLNWVHALQRLPNSWICCEFHLLSIPNTSTFRFIRL
jgi:hypothetical protein